MVNKYQLELSKPFVNKLENLPENGMGYQIVDIQLKNGSILSRRIVLNSTYIKLIKEDNFSLEDIEDITLSKK